MAAYVKQFTSILDKEAYQIYEAHKRRFNKLKTISADHAEEYLRLQALFGEHVE